MFKKLIIAVVIVLFVLGIVFSFMIKTSKKTKPTTPAPTPAAEITDKKEKTVVFKQDTNFAVGGAIKNSQYEISYNGNALAYYVNFKATNINDYRQAKKDAEQAFKKAGATDLCTLRIFFIVPKYIKTGATVQDSVATGCKPQL